MLSFSQGFEYDLDSGLETTTGLGLSLETATRSQSLSFGLSTEIFGDFSDGGSDGFELRNWDANARYTRRGANSSLEFSAQYREINLGDDVFEISPGLIIIGEDGSLTTTSYRARVETGIEGPLGLTVSAVHRDSYYEDTVDPDLIDEVSTAVDVLARFSLSPALSLRALAGVENIEEDDGADTERDITYFGLGVGGETAGGLTFSADVIFDETEVTTSAPSVTVTDGVGFDISVSQERRDGSVGASVSSRIDDTGRRITAAVNRSFDLKNGGLAVSLGVIDQEGVDDLQLIGALTYEAETPRGEMSARLRQSAASSDGEAVLSTSLELAYSQVINAYSGWEAEVGYAASDELIGADDDARTTASIAYRRDLTADWSMRTGYEYSRDDGGDPENSIFFSIERDIAFGF